MTEQRTIAQLGTGTMGLPIARNLAAAGLPLRVWNRSPDKAAPLAGTGVTLTQSPAEAVTGADILLTMLYDVDSVEQTVRQAAENLAAGTTWIQLSTVGVPGERRLAELAAELGLSYVDAPVLGTKKPAEDGALVVLASGPDEARPVCEPVFEAIGSRTIWLGPAGAGSRLKLVANAWVLAVLEGISESLTLAGGLGLDPALFLEAIRGGALDAPYVQLKGQAMLDGNWAPSFAVDGAAKDAGLILQAAEQAGVALPITEAALDYLRQASAAGHGDKDMAAIHLAHQHD
ncbi:MAG: NAD(P)-dependent oxidoreductase [Actinomycetota bacterium]|nr:NAD(P)-dependent oxidoreductase [Actinomycetota bacterium]